ncbi:5-deoxy-glucuronate isomerase [Glycomyces algeriensis]|uniref:5-deoxy-glucuronate isomerase n=1 Tax=Glycomyces algeriensis TaxID=256037 RepID=A0A9W6GE93_9ACTN|nr:5-deoxy-glucuronate isomerase [Glycomyces algeriensis]MDA1368587.1 5-deoxy-glucuronate isomerase [Glycomyces algeriensis]MDR7352386.1 5-deoxy-glucuronate isomerase [Glycomyces algeriensis]GLI45123.1 5-deoxy-glucuronate isomerase [Glycomyces algeriensis]
MNTYHLPAGSTADGDYDTVVTPATAGWTYSGLKVLALQPGGTATFATGDAETLVLPLSGGCTVTCDGEVFEVQGRRNVFSRVTDFVYVPRDAEVTVASASGGRFALPSARCERRLTARYGPAEDVPVELRGSGQASRQVNNFCTPETFEADKLIACEVITPGGNWSSYPPHKHDEAKDGEAELEEIYYFEVSDQDGIAWQRVYGTPERPIEVSEAVRSGDVVVIPHGWHGPSAAAPGYDLYYLNVMAGPGEDRAWLISDDPAHAWVRSTWAPEDLDPRLPLSSAVEKEGDDAQ